MVEMSLAELGVFLVRQTDASTRQFIESACAILDERELRALVATVESGVNGVPWHKDGPMQGC